MNVAKLTVKLMEIAHTCSQFKMIVHNPTLGFVFFMRANSACVVAFAIRVLPERDLLNRAGITGALKLSGDDHRKLESISE